jgi:hypothetical protein
MRHNPNSAVHNRSLFNERVRFDVQSAVLERPSADGVLRMLMRNPCALTTAIGSARSQRRNINL